MIKNKVEVLYTNYLDRASRSIDTVLVSDIKNTPNNEKKEVLYVYNYEGVSIRIYNLFDMAMYLNGPLIPSGISRGFTNEDNAYDFLSHEYTIGDILNKSLPAPPSYEDWFKTQEFFESDRLNDAKEFYNWCIVNTWNPESEANWLNWLEEGLVADKG